MPKCKGIGQSDETPIKQNTLRHLLRTQFAICKSVMASRKDWVEPVFYWWDLTAGNGHDANGQPGSAVIFLEEAKMADIRFKAVMIDQDPENCAALERKIGSVPNITIRCGDHNVIFPQYFGRSNKAQLGFIYVDPNGIPPFDLLKRASRVQRFKKTDILINGAMTALKRCSNKARLSDEIQEIDKRQWVIRTPHGQWQWSFLVGSNWMNFPEWKRAGFYEISGSMGGGIIERLSKTAKELKENQMRLGL